MALINKLRAIANAIRSKTGKTEQLSLDNMVTEIEGIQTGSGGEEIIPEEAYTINNAAQGIFAYNNWLWFLKYAKKNNKSILIKPSSLDYLFSQSNKITDELKNVTVSFPETASSSINYLFNNCSQLTAFPTFIGGISSTGYGAMSDIFAGCKSVVEIPDIFDNFTFPTSSSAYLSSLFDGCSSLRKYSNELVKKLVKINTSTFSVYAYMFNDCNVLDEINDLPIHNGDIIYTFNMFSGCFDFLYRLKKFTFETNNGEPLKTSWESQTIVLTNIGYGSMSPIIKNGEKSGITEETRIIDEESYQLLKDNPNSWTTDIAYSRYNHDSAVRTINSLPDTSEYLLANPGNTNTIKFEGNAGSKTDGGAINTLTSEEIAVAAAKGWTVTLV